MDELNSSHLSPLTGGYLLIVIGEPHTYDHKEIIIQKISKGLLSWNSEKCHIDLFSELEQYSNLSPCGESTRNGERIIQYATKNVILEVLIHPTVSTLQQCVRNLLSSFTRHRHVIHAGYTFASNGSWILQDGTFSYIDFLESFQESEVQRVLKAYVNVVTIDLHCSTDFGDWNKILKEPATKFCKLRINPADILNSDDSRLQKFLKGIASFLVPCQIENMLQSSDIVGNIRFAHPTLYIFPGGQGDAALFGINGFNMLIDGGFPRKSCFWDFTRHLDRLDAVLMTRINNNNIGGLGAFLKRKQSEHVYPQIGHFFCNLQNKKTLLSPDGDKDTDPLIVNLFNEGAEVIANVNKLKLEPEECYRNMEPINLYHKVGHGTLNMYVLNPQKDSKEVREFVQKWTANDPSLFSSIVKKDSNGSFEYPVQNLISVSVLLVWLPANTEQNITRILFPGSTPQYKIFEGIEKLKSLEFLKQPSYSMKQYITIDAGVKKQKIIEPILANGKAKIKRDLPKSPIKNGVISSEDHVDNILAEKRVVKVSTTNRIRNESTTVKKAEVEKKTRPQVLSSVSPKKVVNGHLTNNGTVHKSTTKVISRSKMSHSPTPPPPKSTKDATNRKVVESRYLNKKEATTTTSTVRRAVTSTVQKRTVTSSAKTRKEVAPLRIKQDKDTSVMATDSSTLSTPSLDQKMEISKITHELDELSEEIDKEIEVLFEKDSDDQKEAEVKETEEMEIMKEKLNKEIAEVAEDFLICSVDRDKLDIKMVTKELNNIEQKEKESLLIIEKLKAEDKVSQMTPIDIIKFDNSKYLKDAVKTPDEVADLPVHEEADIDTYISTFKKDGSLSSTASSGDEQKVKSDHLETEKVDTEVVSAIKIVDVKENLKTIEEKDDEAVKDESSDNLSGKIEAPSSIRLSRQEVRVRETHISSVSSPIVEETIGQISDEKKSPQIDEFNGKQIAKKSMEHIEAIEAAVGAVTTKIEQIDTEDNRMSDTNESCLLSDLQRNSKSAEVTEVQLNLDAVIDKNAVKDSHDVTNKSETTLTTIAEKSDVSIKEQLAKALGEGKFSLLNSLSFVKPEESVKLVEKHEVEFDKKQPIAIPGTREEKDTETQLKIKQSDDDPDISIVSVEEDRDMSIITVDEICQKPSILPETEMIDENQLERNRRSSSLITESSRKESLLTEPKIGSETEKISDEESKEIPDKVFQEEIIQKLSKVSEHLKITKEVSPDSLEHTPEKQKASMELFENIESVNLFENRRQSFIVLADNDLEKNMEDFTSKSPRGSVNELTSESKDMEEKLLDEEISLKSIPENESETAKIEETKRKKETISGESFENKLEISSGDKNLETHVTKVIEKISEKLETFEEKFESNKIELDKSQEKIESKDDEISEIAIKKIDENSIKESTEVKLEQLQQESIEKESPEKAEKFSEIYQTKLETISDIKKSERISNEQTFEQKSIEFIEKLETTEMLKQETNDQEQPELKLIDVKEFTEKSPEIKYKSSEEKIEVSTIKSSEKVLEKFSEIEKSEITKLEQDFEKTAEVESKLEPELIEKVPDDKIAEMSPEKNANKALEVELKNFENITENSETNEFEIVTKKLEFNSEFETKIEQKSVEIIEKLDDKISESVEKNLAKFEESKESESETISEIQSEKIESKTEFSKKDLELELEQLEVLEKSKLDTELIEEFSEKILEKSEVAKEYELEKISEIETEKLKLESEFSEKNLEQSEVPNECELKKISEIETEKLKLESEFSELELQPETIEKVSKSSFDKKLIEKSPEKTSEIKLEKYEVSEESKLDEISKQEIEKLEKFETELSEKLSKVEFEEKLQPQVISEIKLESVEKNLEKSEISKDKVSEIKADKLELETKFFEKVSEQQSKPKVIEKTSKSSLNNELIEKSYEKVSEIKLENAEENLKKFEILEKIDVHKVSEIKTEKLEFETEISNLEKEQKLQPQETLEIKLENVEKNLEKSEIELDKSSEKLELETKLSEKISKLELEQKLKLQETSEIKLENVEKNLEKSEIELDKSSEKLELETKLSEKISKLELEQKLKLQETSEIKLENVEKNLEKSEIELNKVSEKLELETELSKKSSKLEQKSQPKETSENVETNLEKFEISKEVEFGKVSKKLEFETEISKLELEQKLQPQVSKHELDNELIEKSSEKILEKSDENLEKSEKLKVSKIQIKKSDSETELFEKNLESELEQKLQPEIIDEFFEKISESDEKNLEKSEISKDCELGKVSKIQIKKLDSETDLFEKNLDLELKQKLQPEVIEEFSEKISESEQNLEKSEISKDCKLEKVSEIKIKKLDSETEVLEKSLDSELEQKLQPEVIEEFSEKISESDEKNLEKSEISKDCKLEKVSKIQIKKLDSKTEFFEKNLESELDQKLQPEVIEEFSDKVSKNIEKNLEKSEISKDCKLEKISEIKTDKLELETKLFEKTSEQEFQPEAIEKVSKSLLIEEKSSEKISETKLENAEKNLEKSKIELDKVTEKLEYETELSEKISKLELQSQVISETKLESCEKNLEKSEISKDEISEKLELSEKISKLELRPQVMEQVSKLIEESSEKILEIKLESAEKNLDKSDVIKECELDKVLEIETDKLELEMKLSEKTSEQEFQPEAIEKVSKSLLIEKSSEKISEIQLTSDNEVSESEVIKKEFMEKLVETEPIKKSSLKIEQEFPEAGPEIESNKLFRETLSEKFTQHDTEPVLEFEVLEKTSIAQTPKLSLSDSMHVQKDRIQEKHEQDLECKRLSVSEPISPRQTLEFDKTNSISHTDSVDTMVSHSMKLEECSDFMSRIAQISQKDELTTIESRIDRVIKDDGKIEKIESDIIVEKIIIDKDAISKIVQEDKSEQKIEQELDCGQFKQTIFGDSTQSSLDIQIGADKSAIGKSITKTTSLETAEVSDFEEKVFVEQQEFVTSTCKFEDKDSVIGACNIGQVSTISSDVSKIQDGVDRQQQQIIRSGSHKEILESNNFTKTIQSSTIQKTTSSHSSPIRTIGNIQKQLDIDEHDDNFTEIVIEESGEKVTKTETIEIIKEKQKELSSTIVVESFDVVKYKREPFDCDDHEPESATVTVLTTQKPSDLDVDFEQALENHRRTRGVSDSYSYQYEITSAKFTTGALQQDDLDRRDRISTSSVEVIYSTSDPVEMLEEKLLEDPEHVWGKPLGLPISTPTKSPKRVISRSKTTVPSAIKKIDPIYVDLTYVPHHGNNDYAYVDFFKKIRARYYVFSGLEPTKEIFDALLEAKISWEQDDLEVTIIPTYDTDTLGYWVTENEENLIKYKIDLSPSASRCTINLQDHDTSCSAYRLEF